MPHVSLHYHIVFSTKERRRIIADPWRDELHAYLGGIAKNMNAIPQAIGGPGDHVHLLLGLKATHTLSEVVRQIKRGSSEWIHRHGIRMSLGRKDMGLSLLARRKPIRYTNTSPTRSNIIGNERLRTNTRNYCD
jgi:REP element-mobilizing transposase RayT